MHPKGTKLGILRVDRVGDRCSQTILARNFSVKNGVWHEKQKTLGPEGRFATYPQRVLHSRFFGASPVASALDLRLGRDPVANGITLLCPCIAVKQQSKNNHCPDEFIWPVFRVTLHGRF
jgi:hypothetical protein